MGLPTGSPGLYRYACRALSLFGERIYFRSPTDGRLTQPALPTLIIPTVDLWVAARPHWPGWPVLQTRGENDEQFLASCQLRRPDPPDRS